MSAKTDRKERSHETILDSAARLVRQKGIGGLSVAEVMKGAGLTVGGFYAHFDSKQELVDAALRRRGASRLFTDFEGKEGPERIATILRRYLSAAHRDDPSHGCPLPAVVGEIGTSAPEHAGALAERLEAMVAPLEASIARRRTLPARHVALGLVALMYGGLSLARAARGTRLSDEMLKACRALGDWAVRDLHPEEEER